MNGKINPIIYVVLAVVVLGGLFMVMKPQSAPTPSPTPQPTTTQISSSSATPVSNIKTFELVIKDKKLVSGPETISVTQGDEVVIKVTADIEDEVHLHGYDKSVDLVKDQPVELKFTADLTGRFPYELENSKVELGALEVQPK